MELTMLEQIKKEMKSLTQNGLPFMEGREKGTLADNSLVTVVDFGFMKDEGKQYICFITKEDDEHFYFGGQVMTDAFLKAQERFASYLPVLLEEGIPVRFGKKQSQNKRVYTTVELFPTV